MTVSPKFESLGLIEPLLLALHAQGYTDPTPIQAQAIPRVLEERDLLGCAQTGTGKTAAFALPILQILSKRVAAPKLRGKPRVLVLAPTRELAAQIAESFKHYGNNLNFSVAVIFGGVGQRDQVNALRGGVDVLVATPGRLLDLMEQRHVTLDALEIFVLDEADRMLDMGFSHDVKRIIKVLPKKRQSLFFSATMPPDIQRLAREILTDPVKVEVTPVATTAEKIDQCVYFIGSRDGKRALLEQLMKDSAISRALVFTRTKHGADRVARFLNAIQVRAEAIHGNKSQNNRVRALESFKQGETRVLVATDIAARGIDIDSVSHVINYEIPNIAETYVHRIGRTARAEASGISISFCDQEEREFLRDIERLIRQKIRVVEDHPFAGDFVSPIRDTHRPAQRPSTQRQSEGRGRSRSRGARPASGHGARSEAARGPNSRDARRGRDSSSGPRSEHRSEDGSENRPEPRGQRQHGRAKQSASRNSSARAPQSGRSAGPRRVSAAKATSRKEAATTTPEKKPWWKRLSGIK